MKERYDYPMNDEKGPASRGDKYYEESFAKMMDKRAKERREQMEEKNLPR